MNTILQIISSCLLGGMLVYASHAAINSAFQIHNLMQLSEKCKEEYGQDWWYDDATIMGCGSLNCVKIYEIGNKVEGTEIVVVERVKECKPLPFESGTFGGDAQ